MISIDEAVAYNRERAPLAVRDQTTWRLRCPAKKSGVMWVARHQRALGLEVDGKLGPMTTAALEMRYGPLDTKKHTRVPMPFFVHRWGYDHAHDVDDLDWPTKSPAFEAATDDGSWESGAARLVAGYEPRTGTFHRAPDSYISLDGGSFGLAHYWGADAAPLISLLARELPAPADEAWGEQAGLVADERRLARELGRAPGKMPHRHRLSWLVAGWRKVARQERAIHLQVDEWLQDKVREGRRLARAHGWGCELARRDGGRILAACTRLANSGYGKGRRYIAAASRDSDEGAMTVLERVYCTPRSQGGYGKPDRWVRITGWGEFRGPAPLGWR